MSESHKLEYLDLLGAEFSYGGKGSGTYDCWHLSREIYKRLGVDVPEFDSPSENSLINTMIRDEMWKIVDKIDKPEPYCFVLFKLHPKYVTHIGVVLEDCDSFIHIMQKSRVSVEKLSEPHWKTKIEGFYKWKMKD